MRRSRDAHVANELPLAGNQARVFAALDAGSEESLGHGSPRGGGLLHRLDDVRVSRATAEIAFEPVANVALARLRIAREQLTGREDHSGRAEPALEPVLVPEGLLHRMQLAILRQAFDGGDGPPFDLDSEQRAGLDRPAVEQDGAGAALAGVAAHVRSGQAEDVAQEMDEQQAGLDLAGLQNPVDFDGDGAHVGPPSGPCERTRPGGPWALAPGGQRVNMRRASPRERGWRAARVELPRLFASPRKQPESA